MSTSPPRARRAAGFATFGVLIACALPAASSAKLPRPKQLAPPVVCTMANRMDIFVDEDNILWECECNALKSGHICKWQVVGGVDPIDSRRRHLIKPRRPIAYTIPAVTA